MYAIIKTSGKQFKVEAGTEFEVDRMEGEVGSVVDIDHVLMIGDEGQTTMGNPTVAGAKVSVEIVEHFRGPKLIVFKMKRRKRSRVKNGHRQEQTRLKVTNIALG